MKLRSRSRRSCAPQRFQRRSAPGPAFQTVIQAGEEAREQFGESIVVGSKENMGERANATESARSSDTEEAHEQVTHSEQPETETNTSVRPSAANTSTGGAPSLNASVLTSPAANATSMSGAPGGLR
jgi:hypothetical protein